MAAIPLAKSMIVWACLALEAACVQVPDLAAFFSSPNGLALSYSDAQNWANQEAQSLTQCGVTVPALQALKDAMYLPSMLNLDLKTVRNRLLPLAYQHASPADLNTFYQTLRGSVGLSTYDAQVNAMWLVVQHAQPMELRPIYQVLTGVVGLYGSQAQQLAVNITAAGADPTTLNAVFQSSKRSGMARQAALDAALAAAVAAELDGQPGRYAKDAKLYVAKDFQSYYYAGWFDEWLAAPQEKRTADDGKDYRASEFAQYYGRSWESKWVVSPVAVLRRIASDGKTYELQEFFTHYGDTWQKEWANAYEVLDQCAGLDQQACTRQYACQWKWSGDWTTSCVVQPHMIAAEEATVVV